MRNPYANHVGRRVIVHLDDVVIAGSLEVAHGDTIELSSALAMNENPYRETPVDGIVVIERLNINWMQVV